MPIRPVVPKQLPVPMLAPRHGARALAQGLPDSPGAASARCHFRCHISCSAPRLPIARLGAAEARLLEREFGQGLFD